MTTPASDTATGREPGDQDGSERDAEQADQRALAGHRSRRDRGQGRSPAGRGRGRAGSCARSGAAGRRGRDRTAARLGRRHERRARDVVGGQAQRRCFSAASGRRRCDRGAAVFARGRCAPPGAVRGQEIGADHRAWADRMRGRARHRIGRLRHPGPGTCAPRRSSAKDSRGRRTDGRDGVRVRCPLETQNPGDDLFSRKAALSVSSALESLTSVFGMGTGVASPLESPGSMRVLDVFGSGSTRDPDGPGAGRRR